MAVPPFQPQGYLPVGAVIGYVDGDGTPEDEIHSGWGTDWVEFEERFVGNFPNSSTRPVFYNEVRKTVEFAAEHFPCAVYLISGQFVTGQNDPADLQLVALVPASRMDLLESKYQWLTNRIFNDRECQPAADMELSVYLGLVTCYNPSDHRHSGMVADLNGYRFQLARPLSDELIAGYIQVSNCQGGDTDDHVFQLLTEASAAS